MNSLQHVMLISPGLTVPETRYTEIIKMRCLMVVQINSYIMTENTLFTSMQLTTLHFNPHRSSKQLKVSLQIKHGHTRVLGPVVGFGIHREQSVS